MNLRDLLNYIQEFLSFLGKILAVLFCIFLVIVILIADPSFLGLNRLIN